MVVSHHTDIDTDDEQQSERSENSPSAVRTSILVAALLLVAVVAVPSLPAQVHTPRSWSDGLANIQSVVPQGWGFFTRDPREPSVTPYAQNSDGVWGAANRGPNAQAKYVFGANREGRLTEFDVEGVISGADEALEWTDCGAISASECIDQVLDTVPVSRSSVTGYDLRLCGRVALVQEEPVPLAYARGGGEPKLSAIVLNVDCESLS